MATLRDWFGSQIVIKRSPLLAGFPNIDFVLFFSDDLV